MTQPAAIPYALFLAGGPALAIPFAVLTAWPWLGSLRRADRHRPAARGDREAGGAAAAGAARDRVWRAIAAAKRGLRRCSKASGPCADCPVAAHLLRRQVARRGDGPALWRLRAARRSGIRCRRPCRRPRGLVPPARCAGRRGRTAARHGQGAQAVLRAQCRCRDRGGGGRPRGLARPA